MTALGEPLVRFVVLVAALVNAVAGQGGNPKDPCPAHCYTAGAAPTNWSVYHNLDQLHRCPQRFFFDFSVDDNVDEPNTLHRLRACGLWGADWNRLPASPTPPLPATEVNATFQLGWLDAGSTTVLSGDATSLLSHLGAYLSKGFGTDSGSTVLFGLTGNATFGFYLGSALQREGTGNTFVLNTILSAFRSRGLGGGLVAQLCGPGRAADHVLGLAVAVNGSFQAVQAAVRKWRQAECVEPAVPFSERLNVTGPLYVTAPPLYPVSNDTDFTAPNSTLGNSTALHASLLPRSECRTIQVVSGDSCGSLAAKCGISGATFMSYNTQPNLCATLQPYQHVCCTSGTLPNFQPQPNADGSCATYTTVADDSCWKIAASRSLKPDDLESFNKNTWGWNGCSNLWVGVNICVSKGDPPMPAVIPNAMCGPQVPGTAKPPPGTDLSTLNPCPLNACCDVWGFCGTTAEFCTNTSTGAPGTAAPGTNGCISNCGTSIIRSGDVNWQRIGYFEGYNLGRPCVHLDVSQIDTSQYTHIHYAFATLTKDYQVVIGDIAAQYEFRKFAALTGVKRILSFGGWTFSTDPSTASIFRTGATAANRLAMATSIADFIKSNNLDGVDIDWEYPAAPDMAGASPSDGPNYLAFLVLLKNMLPGKTVSIAAPASFWYLKGFPIKQISAVVDYIVYMTYDLHGQWDFGSKWNDPGCPGGSCLRSDVNLTETINALAMITKAGVPSSKVMVGVTSYGRSYGMTTPGCWGEMCTFGGGPHNESMAEPGPCTGVAGYLSDAEIKDIAASSSRVVTSFFDSKSQTDVLVYDNNQWVGYMSPTTKSNRAALYKSLGLGGVSDWAIDLEDNPGPPANTEPSWNSFISRVYAGGDPDLGRRCGNWTSIPCDAEIAENDIGHTAASRWAALDCDDAWADALDHYRKVDRPMGTSLMNSLQHSFKITEAADCGYMDESNGCSNMAQCPTGHAGDTGPAGWVIWNSLINLNRMYLQYYDSLFQAGVIIDATLGSFHDTFDPVPEDKDGETWLQVLLDIVGMGAILVAAPFFNNFLARLPYFNAADRVDTPKDITYGALATGISIAKDLLAGQSSVDSWTSQNQNNVSALLGQVLEGWGNATEQAALSWFSGTDESLAKLSKLIGGGHLMPVGLSDGNPPEKITQTELQGIILRSFYAFAIPKAWILSKHSPVIIDSGASCGADLGPFAGTSFSDGRPFFVPGVINQVWACYPPKTGKLYFLGTPSGNALDCDNGCDPLSTFGDPCDPKCRRNPFDSLPGMDALASGDNVFGGVTLQDVITGALRTFEANGRKNGGLKIDPGSSAFLDSAMARDITTPGFINIPVCSYDEAWSNWESATDWRAPVKVDPNYATYPCNKV
ncbi:8553ff05-870f-4b92-b10e-2b4ef4e5facd [Thermothielavioides terrestris]|uniref:chitinase n=2 Tax=Thermothielavioides terrestris TaxID=2587410 RepID=G2RCW3_THETT|nr:glycoside hydrolase family 18 protein [Thermothielavioides terrestris NRRL 8126]AEO69851.1 glycoside hydrolase family 18 protein [Thermothielavioides terrestris NRRL 8126]SPQ17647.1 8553ff05-870f-4b92-b10e-2b4ef4e5facd [Thermothielavioides terrestris]